MRKIDYHEKFKSRDEIEPYLDKKFGSYYSFEEVYTYFQEINNTNIKQTGSIIKTAWDIDGSKEHPIEK